MYRLKAKYFFAPLSIALTFFSLSCSQDFRDISTSEGKQAVLDEANNLLTTGECDSAINVLLPLYYSQYVDDDVRLVFASAYACKGGMNVISLLSSLASSGGNIWSSLAKSNISNGADSKMENLHYAAQIVRQTAKPAGDFLAVNRTENSNMFMIFVQSSLIGALISNMGQANSSTGDETVTGWPATSTNVQRCAVSAAIANLRDCIANVSVSSSVTKISDALTTICGGVCPTTKDPTVCNAPEMAAGFGLMTAISLDWTGP